MTAPDTRKWRSHHYRAAEALVFERFVQAAREGERCPSNDLIEGLLRNAGLPQTAFGARKGHAMTLAERGDIRVEVSGKNWRVVEILTGEHAGKRTMPDPKGGRPTRIFEKPKGEKANG